MVAVDAQLAAMLSTEPRIRSKAEVVDAARAAAGLPRRYDYSEPGPAEPDVESPAVASTSSADAAEYAALMEPEPLRFSPVFSLKLGHSEVCGFARACVAAGLEVECTAVAAPGVDLAAARALSEELGATSFRERSYHE